jgi:hypothetical protein
MEKEELALEGLLGLWAPRADDQVDEDALREERALEQRDAALEGLEAARRQAAIAEQVTAATKDLLTRRTATLLARAVRAEAAIARVRALHSRHTYDTDECRQCEEDYPCQTIAALDNVEG